MDNINMESQNHINHEQFMALVEMGKYPLLFIAPIFFENSNGKKINSGTATLVKINENLIGITCSHVIELFLESPNHGETILQVGNMIIDLKKHLISASKSDNLDLTTLRLNPHDLFSAKDKRYPQIGSISVDQIFSGEIKENDTVVLGGFLGCWVENKGNNVTSFRTFSSTSTKVVSAGPRRFSVQFENPNSWAWYKELQGAGRDIDHGGGLSGCPVFKVITSESGIVHFELAGIVYEGKFLADTLIVTSRPINLIDSEGIVLDDFIGQTFLDETSKADLISWYEGQRI